MTRYIFVVAFLLAIRLSTTLAQPVPAIDENIHALVTFGRDGNPAWGDDDFIQIIFFSIPETHTQPVFIRVFDPDAGGGFDEQKVAWNTRTNISVFGGQGAASHEDARRVNRDGNFRSGTMLGSRNFANDTRWDGQWFTFGPFNPAAGELLPEYGGNIFKLVIEGLEGDDGNLYRLFLSTSNTENRPIEGAFAFYFKYKFRLHDDPNEVSHIYPFIDERVVAIKQSNFDWDNDGIIRIVSPSKNGERMAISGENNWSTSVHQISKEDINSSLDIQMIKNRQANIRNNNVVMYLQNQYGELMPFYSIPIGGIPRYRYSIGVRPKTPAR